MSDLLAEVFPERVELELLDSVPAVTAMGAMAAFSDRGLTLTMADPAAIEAFPVGSAVKGSYGDHSGFCQFDSIVVECTVRDGEAAGDGATGDGATGDGATGDGATGDGVGAPIGVAAPIGVIRLEPPKQIRTTQRRRFVRANVEITIPVALLISDRKGMNFLSAPGEVANLGGGGLMMVIAAHPALKVGSKMALAIPAPGGDPVLAVGEAVQVVVPADGPATVRLKFTSIDAIERDRIERFSYRKLGGSAPAKLWAAGKITTTQPDPSTPS
jgi:hypothetical protein